MPIQTILAACSGDHHQAALVARLVKREIPAGVFAHPVSQDAKRP